MNLSYSCTAMCDHCRFSCSNKEPLDVPDFDMFYNTAKSLKDNFGLDMVVVLGGEPSLFGEKTYELLDALKKLNVSTRLETNGSWAKSKDVTKEVLKHVKVSDTSLMLSLDGFHDTFIPFKNIVNAINMCTELGISYNLELPYLNMQTKDHPIDKRTEELFRQLQDKMQIDIPKYEGNIVFVGRAAKLFGDDFSINRGIPQEICTAVPWWIDSDLNNMNLLILEPGGYLTKGCGIALGNVLQQDVVEIVKNYNIQNHPIFSILYKEGPLGLGKIAQNFGFRFKENYADKCH